MKRVAVVGSPGAGKTYFSRRLAEKTSLPIVHLDFYYNDKNLGYENNRDAWIKMVEKIVAKDRWIIDGNYKSTFPSRFSRADTIIFLDYPRWRAVKGIYKRRLQYRNKVRSDMPEGWIEKVPRDFFLFVWKFNKKNRQSIVDALQSNDSKKIIIFRKPADAEKYLEKL